MVGLEPILAVIWQKLVGYYEVNTETESQLVFVILLNCYTSG